MAAVSHPLGRLRPQPSAAPSCCRNWAWATAAMKAPAWGPKAEPVGYSDACPFVDNDADPLPEQGSATIEDLNALALIHAEQALAGVLETVRTDGMAAVSSVLVTINPARSEKECSDPSTPRWRGRSRSRAWPGGHSRFQQRQRNQSGVWSRSWLQKVD